MKFIDHTGHIFQLKSYDVEPIGYEYEETKYVFWFDNEQGYKISVNTYAIKPIRFIVEKKIYKIEISVNSQKFSLLSSKVVQEKVDKLNSISERIIFDENDKENESNGIFSQILYTNQLNLINNLKVFNNDTSYYTLIPFYVAVKSAEAGTWQTNVLVHIIYIDKTEEWCPLTVGAEIVDECEELIINGQNMGVYLPKEILKAVYQCGYNDNKPNERLYAQKLKEYLMNFMHIKGQVGNYKSVLDSLKWFGWGDKLDIYKLLKTDNEFQTQYIRDNFDIINDTIYAYRFFKNESLLAISLEINGVSEDTMGFDFQLKKDDETEEEYELHRHNFWGEDKPKVTDLFKENVIVHYDEADLDFYKPYFDYEFNELGLKLCMLKYYYEKYFLPLHISINSLSVMQRVFANDIKYISNCSPKITAEPIFIKDASITVKFPYVKELFLKAQYHEVDDNFIEFNFNSSDSNYEAKWKIYETCACVPITFLSKRKDQYFDTIIKLYKDDVEIYSRSMQFNLSDLFVNEKFYKYVVFTGTPDGTDTYYMFSNGNYIEVDSEYIINNPDKTYFIKQYEHYLNFIIHPKTLNRYIGYDYVESQVDKNKKMALNLWLDSNYKIVVWANNNNYEYDFTMRLPDMGLRMGKLTYKYSDLFKQLYLENKKPHFLSFMWNPDLVTLNNIDYMDDLYFFQDAMQEYVNKNYKTILNIVDEKKYLNKCHLYKIFVRDEHDQYNELQYNGFDFSEEFSLTIEGVDEFKVQSGTHDLDIEENLNIYKTLFDFENAEENKYIKCKQELVDVIDYGKVKYDFYLMHDKNNWYALLLSKNTIENFTANELLPPELPDIEDFSFEYDKSDEKFLVNRYILNETKGVNKFKSNDIIAFYLESNYKLPYKIGLSTKWLIKPLSIGMNNEFRVDSPSEIAIVSIGDKNFKYEKGYYTVVCRYSLDDFYQESIEKKGIFMVDDEEKINKQDTKPEPEHEYVDLGLSVKWATENITNENNEDYYFAWGEIKGFTETEINNNERSFSFSNYTYNDNPETLDSSHDAATQL